MTVDPYAGRNRRTVNFLRAIRFDHPEWIPCRLGIMPATWAKYREALEEIVLAHPRIFPGFRRGQVDFDSVPHPLYEEGAHTDSWGTVWENVERGLDSIPVGHPLADWNAFAEYDPPDPMTQDLFGPRPSWDDVRTALDGARRRGDLATGAGLPHGFMFMRLFYLRGFENLMMDLATESEALPALIGMVESHNRAVIDRYLELGCDFVHLADDLGLQNALPMSPATWRRWIRPSYERMLASARDRGIPVGLHTDGHILEIIPDLIEVGVRMLNPQVRANGLEGLKEIARGRVALDQDLDRQLFPFASPAQIEDHVAEVIDALLLPEGGLLLYAECEPDIPLANIDALCRAFEKQCNPPVPDDG